MPDRAALITALILDRSLCMFCIASKSQVTVDRASEALAAIASALVLSRDTDRCVACGEATTVYSVGRPRLT
jgi:hypothetical protein